jgi:hypothetical protein
MTMTQFIAWILYEAAATAAANAIDHDGGELMRRHETARWMLLDIYDGWL